MCRKQSLSHIGTVSDSSMVQVRATAKDQFSGLKGRDYIKARGLNKPVQRVQTFTLTAPQKASD